MTCRDYSEQGAFPPRDLPSPPSGDALPWLLMLALVVGCITGLGAVAFRDLIGFVHNLLFLRQMSFTYDASHFTPGSPWGVFDAIYYKGGSAGHYYVEGVGYASIQATLYGQLQGGAASDRGPHATRDYYRALP